MLQGSRQGHRPTQQHRLHTDAIADSLRNPGEAGRKHVAGTVMEEPGALILLSPQQRRQALQAPESGMAPGDAFDPQHTADVWIGAKQAVSLRTRLGQDIDPPLDGCPGDRMNMRQMPDHVADAWQGLHDQRPPGRCKAHLAPPGDWQIDSYNATVWSSIRCNGKTGAAGTGGAECMSSFTRAVS